MKGKFLVCLVSAVSAIFISIVAGQQTPPAQKEKTAPPRDVKVTTGPVVRSVTDTRVEISWSTNVDSDTVLHYGTDANELQQTVRALWGGRVHQVVLENLKPSTTYYFRVGTSAVQKTEPMISPATFRTQPTRKAP